ncbi:MAG: hypothetical protein AMXMBFR58_04180 [Phycisphaerae bacterium]
MNRDAVLDHPPSTSIGTGLLSSIILHVAGVVALALLGNQAGGAAINRSATGVQISLDAIPPVPPPKPPEESTPPDQEPRSELKLGIADGVTQTETWLGYKDPTPHVATPATIEQAAMSIASGPMSEIGKVGGESPVPQDALDAPSDQDLAPAPPEMTPAPVIAQTDPSPPSPPAPTSTLIDPPVEAPTPTPDPAPPAQEARPALTQPPPPPIEDAPVDVPDADPPAPDLTAPVAKEPTITPATPPLDPEPAPADQPVDEHNPAEPPADAKTADQTQDPTAAPAAKPDAKPDAEVTEFPQSALPPAEERSDTPDARDPRKSPPQDQPPTTAEPRPTPPSPTAPTSRAPAIKGTRPGTSGRPGDLTDQYADPTSLLRDVVDVVPGRPAAAKGLKIKTTPPQWGVTTMLIRSARNPIVWIKFGRDGKVISANFVKGYSAGSPDVDGPLLDAIHEWRAEGEELKKIPAGKDSGITITMRITLRSI